MLKKLLTPFVLFLLRTAAKVQLAKYHPTIIGIAGSSGKTSLTQLVGKMLAKKKKVLATSGQNSEIGLPLYILGITIYDNSIFDWMRIIFLIPLQLLFNWKTYEILIAEMGIDSPVEPKNMSYLLKIVKPTIGAVTNVSLEHSVYFEPYVQEVNPQMKAQKILELTAQQETLLLTSLPEDGTAIINLDDVWIAKAQQSIFSKKLTLSLEKDADLVGKDIISTLTHFSMIVAYNGKNYPLTINQPLPKHFAYEFLFALAIGLVLKMTIDEAIDSLTSSFSLPAGRLSFFKGVGDTILIDSTYNNATLPPILDILDFVQEIADKHRKVVILGDMRELGQEAQELHEAVARKILETVDFAFLIGPLSEKYMAPILKKEGFPFEDFPDVTSSKQAILNSIRSGDIILVKGSQNTLFLERIVEMLLENKEDVKLLTRRGALWDKKRSESL